MTKTVEFYFDFGSPYSYLAYKELPRLAGRRGAQIVWRPILLGGVFKATGNHSPAEIPAKSKWLHEDLRRWASRYGASFRLNPHFPINTLTLMRGAAGLLPHPTDFARYVEAVFRGIWAEARNLGDPAVLAALLDEAGFDPDAFAALVAEPEVKERLRRDTEEAVARGVFGVPTFFVGEQMFWGQDRLDFVDAALAASV